MSQPESSAQKRKDHLVCEEIIMVLNKLRDSDVSNLIVIFGFTDNIVDQFLSRLVVTSFFLLYMLMISYLL